MGCNRGEKVQTVQEIPTATQQEMPTATQQLPTATHAGATYSNTVATYIRQCITIDMVIRSQIVVLIGLINYSTTFNMPVAPMRML